MAVRRSGRAKAVVEIWFKKSAPIEGFWLEPVILGHDGGLAARPPVRYTLRVEGELRLSFFLCPGRASQAIAYKCEGDTPGDERGGDGEKRQRAPLLGAEGP